MLTPRLTECEGCANMQSLINTIDCKVATLASNLYYNATLMVSPSPSAKVLFSLLTYKRILQSRWVNPNYACKYNLSDIASRVNILKYKQ